MPQPVKCKVCGVAHWGPDHVWPDTKPPVAPKVVKLPKTAPPSEAAASGDLAAYLAAEKAKKAAYMRGYRARKN